MTIYKNDFINIKYFHHFKKSYVVEKPLRNGFFFLINYFLDTIVPDSDHHIFSNFKVIGW